MDIGKAEPAFITAASDPNKAQIIIRRLRLQRLVFMVFVVVFFTLWVILPIRFVYHGLAASDLILYTLVSTFLLFFTVGAVVTTMNIRFVFLIARPSLSTSSNEHSDTLQT